MSWYTIQTSPNSEFRVQKMILATKKLNATANAAIEEVLVPEESVFVYKDRERKVARRRMYANYVFLRGSITDDRGHLLPDLINFFGEIPGMRGFMGGYSPAAMKPEEAESMLTRAKKDIAVAKYSFSAGETVRVKEGPFMSLTATVKSFSAEDNRLEVTVDIFGRLTPVTLTPDQVDRTAT